MIQSTFTSYLRLEEFSFSFLSRLKKMRVHIVYYSSFPLPTNSPLPLNRTTYKLVPSIFFSVFSCISVLMPNLSEQSSFVFLLFFPQDSESSLFSFCSHLAPELSFVFKIWPSFHFPWTSLPLLRLCLPTSGKGHLRGENPLSPVLRHVAFGTFPGDTAFYPFLLTEMWEYQTALASNCTTIPCWTCLALLPSSCK